MDRQERFSGNLGHGWFPPMARSWIRFRHWAAASYGAGSWILSGCWKRYDGPWDRFPGRGVLVCFGGDDDEMGRARTMDVCSGSPCVHGDRTRGKRATIGESALTPCGLMGLLAIGVSKMPPAAAHTQSI